MRKQLGWFLASVLLVGVLQFTPTLIAQPNLGLGQDQAQQPGGGQQQQQQTFTGKISKSNGKYVLQSQDAKTSYTLDDQDKAKQFDGQNVKVTGTLDSQSNVIHVSDIQPS